MTTTMPKTELDPMAFELPPMPKPVSHALVDGPAMQGSEYRSLSENWEPHTAMHSHDQMQAYARSALLAYAKAIGEMPKGRMARLCDQHKGQSFTFLANACVPLPAYCPLCEIAHPQEQP